MNSRQLETRNPACAGRSKLKTQKGAFLLVLVLVLGMAVSFALVGYLALLTQTTRGLEGQLHAEQAHYATYAYFSESLDRYLSTPTWLSNLSNPSSQTINYLYAGIPIARSLIRNNQGVTVDISSQVVQTYRRLTAHFQFGQSGVAPADIVMVIDKSGSMGDDGAVTPPLPCPAATETHAPMVQAICAGRNFIDVFKNNNLVQIGVIKFSTTAQPINNNLGHLVKKDKFPNLQSAISDLQANGWTNSGEAINQAISFLSDTNYKTPNAHPYIVFFTDGIPTVTKTGQTCDDNNINQSNLSCIQPGATSCSDHNLSQSQLQCLRAAGLYALEQSQVAKNDYHATVYTIGLGQNVNEPLLKTMATAPSYYYLSPDKSKLDQIFTGIAADIQSATLVTLREQAPE